MAKARSKKRRFNASISNQTWRDNSYPITRTPLPRRYLPSLSVIEDMRTHHPRPRLRTLRSIHASPIFSRTRVGLFSRNLSISRNRRERARLRRLSFDIHRTLPLDAVICAKRHVRAEVLFAKNKAGRGGQRRPRRNENSEIICRS